MNRLRPGTYRLLVVSAMSFVSVLSAGVDDSTEALKARIETLRAPSVAWRQIRWKSCLLDGLKESREKKKPLLLWVFIDRPADDARC